MSQQELIAEAWALTEAIEQAAADNDWLGAAQLTNTRSPLLMALQADQPDDSMITIRRIQTSISIITNMAELAERSLMNRYRTSIEHACAASRYQRAAQF